MNWDYMQTWNTSGMQYGDGNFQMFRNLSRIAEDNLEKSLVTGQGIVQAGTTGGPALRLQMLHGVLEQVSFEQDDAMAMKIIPKEKIYSNTFEWTIWNSYGGPGDGFTPETGTDGAFGLTASDDNFTRLVLQLKYMAAYRLISLAAQMVKNIEDPETVAQKGATLEIIGKADLAIYNGDSNYHTSQFDGLIRQITSWVDNVSASDQAILYDANNSPLDDSLLEDISIVGAVKFGRPTLLLSSSQAYGDMMKTLFPKGRYNEGDMGAFGTDKRTFVTPYGKLKLVDDKFLRPGLPLVVEGNGTTGRPLATNAYNAVPGTAAGNNVWSQTPVPTGAVVIQAAGTAGFWHNTTFNGDTALVAAPAQPSGDGNQHSQLPVGNTCYYAVALVYQGIEGPAWIYGKTSAAVSQTSLGSGNATQLTTTSGSPNVQICADVFNAAPGFTSATSGNYKVRVYRCDSATAPTSLSQFGCIGEMGCPAASISWASTASLTATMWDNGFKLPHGDNAFMITESKGGAKGWFLAQLLPLMRRLGLPALPMGDPVAMLAFIAPVLYVRRHHIWIRNIAKLN